MTFTCEIRMDNAAFDDEPATELARIVKLVATAIEQGHIAYTCYDINGNTVGHWAVEDDDACTVGFPESQGE